MHHLSCVSFMAPSRVAENIARIKAYAGHESTQHVIEALEELQGCPKTAPNLSRHRRLSNDDMPSHKWVIGELMGGEFPESFRILSQAEFTLFYPLALRAEDLWREEFPSDFHAYEQLVRNVVYAFRDSYTGGSNSNCVGWIWLSPEPDWTEQIFLENLIHEYTHNALFLEEMVHTIFSVSGAEMMKEENRVVSAIRRTPRYFDQAYHAAGVAIVLIELALHQKRYCEARILIEGLLISLDALTKKRKLLTKHGEILLFEMIAVGLQLNEVYSNLVLSMAA